MSEEPETDLEVYLNDIETTVEAAIQAGHPRNELHNQLDTLLTQLGEEYDHQIEDADAFADELDALVRNAYLPGDEVATALAEKAEELEQIGENAPDLDELEGQVDVEGEDPLGQLDLE